MCTDNKNVLIVGGSGKIGSSIASRMISKGYRVFIAARDEQKLLEVQSMLGEKCHPLVLDVSKSDKDISAFFESFKNEYGNIDVLIYAAGSHGSMPFETCTTESFDASLSVDLRGCYFVCQAYINSILNCRGQIIIISSVSSLNPAITSGQIAKWGIRGFIAGLGAYCANKNINVFGIAPGHLSGKNNIEERVLLAVENMCTSPTSYSVGELTVID